MYFLTPVCCLCLNNSNQMLYNLFNTDADNMSYYDKLSTTLTHLVFNKNHHDYMLCTKCCININSVYEFNNRSIESLNTFLGYKEKLNSSTCESCEITVRLVDIEDIGEDNKCIEQDRSTDQGIEVIVDSCDSENKITHSIDEKLEKFEEYYNNIQHLMHLGSENNLGLNTEVVLDVKQEIHVEKYEQPMDVISEEDVVSENGLGESVIKIEETDMKMECFGVDGAFDEFLDTHNIIDDNIAHNQLGESSRHSEHKFTEINKQSQYCDPQRPDNIDALNLTSPANHTKVRADTCSTGVDVTRIHKFSTSEGGGSKQLSSPIAHSLRHTSYACDVCDMKCKNSRSLVNHKAAHTLKKPHVCEICKEGFSYLSRLVRHKLIHTGEKPYACNICNKRFSQSTSVVTHKRIHTGQKPFVCHICRKGFGDPFDLVKHKQMAHKNIIRLEHSYSCIPIPRNYKPSTSEEGGFKQSSSLIAHSLPHPSYVCDVCDMRFKRSRNLANHKVVHTKPLVCEFCKKGFRYLSQLVRHKRIHTDEKPYVCDICKKGFGQSSGLVRHKRIHTRPKPYVCDICKKRFTHTFSLARHKRIHSVSGLLKTR